MIDFKSLPSSLASPLNEITLPNNEFVFTYTENVDENNLYRKINVRLNELERSLEMNKEELKSIILLAEGFRFAVDEKEEVQLRIEWLNRLYKAKERIGAVKSKGEAIQIQRLISPVPICPMKGHLMEKIDSLDRLFQNETYNAQVFEQELMEKAIEEIGELFINLGVTGRKFVIASVLEQFGSDASIENIKDTALALEQRVNKLLKENSYSKFITILEQLPLLEFNDFQIERKKIITDCLFKNKNWFGIADLNRKIGHLDKVITNEIQEKGEFKNIIETKESRAAFIINIDNDINSIIK